MNNLINEKKGEKINIAIMASGSGTNAENIVQYFSKDMNISVSLILTNKADAYVIQRAKTHKIPCIIFNRDDFYTNGRVLNVLSENNINFIVLAGFLWLIPENLIQSYPQKIINIHPALLPDFGGKGMYGNHVHQKVIETGQTESGITIHFVNEKYDDGDILFQAKCKVDKQDTPESLAKKIHELEYLHYPKVIGELLLSH